MLQDKMFLTFIIDTLCEKSDSLKTASSYPDMLGGCKESILHARNESEMLDKVIGELQGAYDFYFPKRK